MSGNKNLYNNTFGKVFDYNSLGQFIRTNVDLKQFEVFIDLASGTGKLLEDMAKASIKFIGIDNDINALELSKKNNKHVEHIHADILNFEYESITSANIYCHGGYCLLNQFNKNLLQKLFKRLSSNSHITQLGFEIQNSIYQINNYKFGISYSKKLANGYTIKSRLQDIDGLKKKIEILFLKGGTIRSQKSITIYSWPLSTILEISLREGWYASSILKCDYREDPDYPSHYYINLRRYYAH